MKSEVKRLLKESGHGYLYTEDNYATALFLTRQQEKKDKNLKAFFKTLEGMKAKYIHDLIVKNKERLCLNGGVDSSGIDLR